MHARFARASSSGANRNFHVAQARQIRNTIPAAGRTSAFVPRARSGNYIRKDKRSTRCWFRRARCVGTRVPLIPAMVNSLKRFYEGGDPALRHCLFLDLSNYRSSIVRDGKKAIELLDKTENLALVQVVNPRNKPNFGPYFRLTTSEFFSLCNLAYCMYRVLK